MGTTKDLAYLVVGESPITQQVEEKVSRICLVSTAALKEFKVMFDPLDKFDSIHVAMVLK